jgi:glutamate-ammonia-ligase adenylyltransferase
MSKRIIESLCSGIDKRAVDEFFARMDDDYFSTFVPEDIADHIRMSLLLDRRNPVLVRIMPRNTEFDIVIVGFDYLSEFSILCGLLTAFGLDIRRGDIYSFNKDTASPRRKIVDVFRVGVKAGENFGEARQSEFEKELLTLAQMLVAGSMNDARERLNRFLTERIENMNEPLSGLMAPVQIEFDNTVSSDWTVLTVHSEDTFGFLYAISNALAMRGTYIHKVKIRGSGHEVMDRFFVADSLGHKIENKGEQERLRMAVTMIKQFTRFLPDAPDPAKAMRHFDQLMDRTVQEFPDHVLSFLASPEGMSFLAHLLGSSDFLWDEFLAIRFAELLPVLEDLHRPLDKDSIRRELDARLSTARTFEEKKEIVNRFKDRQLFSIDVRHLVDPSAALPRFSKELTDLAEVVIDAADKICRERIPEADGRLTICGLGKFGGREMGYASDLELLFVHEGSAQAYESLARHIVDFIEARPKGIFQIDLRLRPYGDKGGMSSALELFTRYYSPNGAAAPFERQAFIKLRWVAGDEVLGRLVEAHRDSFTYSGVQWDWENAMHLRSRQLRELVEPGQVNVKYGAGGIVEIEYAVQYLQLLNGAEHPEIRQTNTLDAMEWLRRLQIVRESDYAVLNDAYLFLRKLIDALRIVRGDASDLVLPEQSSDEFKSLARRLGYRDRDRNQSAQRLAADIQDQMTKVHEYFLRRFSRG